MKTFKSLRESKYEDAMMSRLPAHLDDPRVEPKKVVKKPVKRNPKDHSWKLYREEAKLDRLANLIKEELTGKHKDEGRFGFIMQYGMGSRKKPTMGVKRYKPEKKKTDTAKAALRQRDLKEELTPREKISGGERLKEKEKPAVDAHQKKSFLSMKQFDYKKFSKDRAEHPEKFVAGLREARLHHTLKGHPYHYKSNAELHYIMKDAHEAEKAVGTHDTKAMWKYADQQNDAASILGYRQRGGKQLHHPKPEGEVQEAFEVMFNEESTRTYQYGDKVSPKSGSHKGVVHTVVAVHPSGHLNIATSKKVGNGHSFSSAYVHSNDVEPHTNLTESQGEYKVGDRVIPKIGPHKGEVHKVIHVHATGHVNIQPERHGEGRKNRYHLGAARAHPSEIDRAPVKESFAFLKSGVNRRTVQEVFAAAKDKKKVDFLQDNEAEEPKKEFPGTDAPPTTQDGGAPKPEKKSNALKPENAGKSKKMEVKGPGGEDKFQPDPIVTPLTTMPDTSSPKTGSQGVR